MARAAISVGLIAALAAGLISAGESATLWGLVLDAAGNPVPGYGVVVQDITSGASWTSPPSTPAGQYQLAAPIGASYRTVGVVTPGGARIPLDPGVPVQARRPVRYRLDVRLPQAAANQAPAPGEPNRPASPGSGAEDRAPWWKTPGGIIGLVAVQGAVLAVILMNNDEETSASPASP